MPPSLIRNGAILNVEVPGDDRDGCGAGSMFETLPLIVTSELLLLQYIQSVQDLERHEVKMLLDLPGEILNAILSELTDRRDLGNVCRVSKYLYSAANPVLYQSVVIAVDDDLIYPTDVEGMLHANRRGRFLHCTKDIQISCPFQRRLSERCLHNTPDEEDAEDDEFADDTVNEEGLDAGELQDKDDDTVDEEGLDAGELQDKKAWIDDDDEDEEEDFRLLKDRVMSVLIRCKDGGLRKFTWRVGTCVPDQILGRDGYLPLKQKDLESIHLVTDGSCQWNFSYDLKAFTKLTRLSWTGLRSPEDFQALRDCLEATSHQLVQLELDLLRWEQVRAYNAVDDDDNFIAWDILKLRPGREKLLFPALQQLSLSAVSFTSAEEEMASAFDFRSLRALRLRFCPGWEAFLLHVSSSRQPIRLQTLEIQSHVEYDDGDDEASVISAFLEVIEGLQELFICTASPSKSLDIWRSMLRHRSTLRKFVHHQRSVDFRTEDPYDAPHLSFRMPDDIPTLEDPSKNPFSGLDLECIGLCCDPQYLKSIIAPLTEKNSLTVLHIRQSGSDLRHLRSWAIRNQMNAMPDASARSEPSDNEIMEQSLSRKRKRSKISGRLHRFAQWAFGPNGFRSLQVLAFGDFSYCGRYSVANVLLCRKSDSALSVPSSSSGKNYRLLTKGDLSERDLLRKYSHVLEACPTELLLDD